MADIPQLMTETLISLPQAARMLPAFRGNGRTSPTTLWRWISAGVRLPTGERLRLEGIRIGGRWLTTVEAITRFAKRQTDIREPPPESGRVPGFRTPEQRRRAVMRAGERLKEMETR
jgi:hypothetical protein